MSERNFSYQLLTNPYISNSIDWTKESCYFESQDSILAHPFELDHYQNFENHIDILVSYPFPEIELENECDLEPQIDNSISFLDSIMTLVSLPDFNPFSESVLDLVAIHCEIELLIFYDHHTELDQYQSFKNFIDKLASSYFYEIEINQECDPDLQFCDPVQISESILTPVVLSDLSIF